MRSEWERKKEREGGREGESDCRLCASARCARKRFCFAASPPAPVSIELPLRYFPSFLHPPLLSSSPSPRRQYAWRGLLNQLNSTRAQLAPPLRALRWRGPGTYRSAWCSSSGGRGAVWRRRTAGRMADGSGERRGTCWRKGSLGWRVSRWRWVSVTQSGVIPVLPVCRVAVTATAADVNLLGQLTSTLNWVNSDLLTQFKLTQRPKKEIKRANSPLWFIWVI